MRKFSNTNSGFTIIEVLVSVGILLVFLPFAASMLTNSQLLASYSKHKSEAAYVAQELIETQRQNAFLVIASGHSVTQGPSSVILDTKGNYSSLVCNGSKNVFCGTEVVTVTPSVYTNSAGIKTTSTLVDHFVISISWVEQILKFQIPMSETYAADIANDPMLN